MARPSPGSLAAICFGVLTAVVVTARPAAGCSCVTGAPVCEAFWQATAVFTGRVTDIEPVTAQEGPPRTYRLVHFEVIDAFRGVTSESTVALVTGQGGGDCGYEFRPGNAYIVYAVTNPQSGQLTTSICSRTRLVGEASDDIAYARAIRTNPTAGGTISGTVRDGDRLNDDRHEYAAKSGVAVVLTRDGVEYRTVTDQSGAFQIGGLAAGTYAVRVETGPNDYAEPFPREVVLRDERGCAAVDAVVRHDGRIRGRVVDASGRPVPFVGVELWSADYVTQRGRRFHAELEVRSGEHGEFMFTRVPAGRYLIGSNAQEVYQSSRDAAGLDAPHQFLPGVGNPAAATIVEVGLDAPVDVPDFVWSSDVPLVTIRGRAVTPAGAPAAGAKIYVTAENTSLPIGGAPAISDVDGRFSIAVLAGLRCALTAEWPTPTKEKPWTFDVGTSTPFSATEDLAPFELVVRPVPPARPPRQ